MNLLLTLSLHGTVVFLLVTTLDDFLAPCLRASSRRWWWLLVPAAFLILIPLAVLPPQTSPPVLPFLNFWSALTFPAATPLEPSRGMGWNFPTLLPAFWLLGAIGYLGLVLVRTRGALGRWSRARLCTDSRLLNLLEDAKIRAEVTAPIGLVVSDTISTPALLGWLRPRILLPAPLVATLPAEELRAVLLHELAHFRALDLPANWFFTLACALHWFNPFSHLAFLFWSRFQEEAADEAVLTWLPVSTRAVYGEALLHTLKVTHDFAPPYGALALGESISQLKYRITMIHHHPDKSPRLLLTAFFLVLLGSFILHPVRAENSSDPKTAAVAAIEVWLKEIDANEYAQSWIDASPDFQKALTSEKWVAALTSVRTPLGTCLSREVASVNHQDDRSNPTSSQPGDYMIVQFKTSFSNLYSSLETVTFEKTADGTWKAAGYFIKPA